MFVALTATGTQFHPSKMPEGARKRNVRVPRGIISSNSLSYSGLNWVGESPEEEDGEDSTITFLDSKADPQ